MGELVDLQEYRLKKEAEEEARRQEEVDRLCEEISEIMARLSLSPNPHYYPIFPEDDYRMLTEKDFYLDFENTFRGTRSSILDRVSVYNDLLHLICKNNPNAKILDIGCGRGGDVMKWFHARIKNYVGFDPDYEGIYSSIDGIISRYNSRKKVFPQ